MKTFVLAGLLAGTATAIVPTAANAATIVYTLTGNFTGTRDTGDGAQGFSNVAATFTAVGDTTTRYITFDGQSRNVLLSSLSAVAGGETFDFFGSSLRFGTNNGYAGFIVDVDGNNPSVFYTSTLAGYDGISNVAPTPVTYIVSNGTFFTSGGFITLTDQTNLVFSAVVESAVPEASTWAMMLAGFGMVGFGMRYRKRSATVTYA